MKTQKSISSPQRLVSVPCRGTTFLNSHKIFCQERTCCFRPLSGNYISQYVSPVTQIQQPVSVPCRGTTFLNLVQELMITSYQFPSPVGELHFSIKIQVKCHLTLVSTVSVPCRGTTFLNTIPAIPPPVWAHGRDCVGKIFLEK